jgi:hypothetical protein
MSQNALKSADKYSHIKIANDYQIMIESSLITIDPWFLEATSLCAFCS